MDPYPQLPKRTEEYVEGVAVVVELFECGPHLPTTAKDQQWAEEVQQQGEEVYCQLQS